MNRVTCIMGLTQNQLPEIIHIWYTAPIAKRPYRMAPIEHEEVKKTIDELLAKGYIHRSFSHCAFPLWLVDKKDGSKRMYVNYRELNAFTIKNKHH